LLASIEKFEASQDDFDIFKAAEMDVFNLVKCWLDAFSGVSVGGLRDDFSGIIPEGVGFNVKFAEPSENVSETQKLESILKRLDNGLISRVEAIMKDREITEDDAREVIDTIDEDSPLQGLISGDRVQET
jgi:hypothetical protein